MADMRVVIAGAGGRMGRTLIHAIAATKGLALAGAVDAPGSAVIGRDAGELAGLGPNGIKVASDVAPLLKAADGLIEFTIPAATLAFAELTAAAGLVHVIGTTGHSAEEEAVIAQAANRATHRKIRQCSWCQSAFFLVKRVAADAQRRLRHRNFRNAPQQEDRCAVRHRAPARPRRGRRPRSISRTRRARRDGITGARHPATSALPPCAAALWSASTASSSPARRARRAHPPAEDRLIFARGALHAALWARGKKPGLYSMADVLGLGDK